MLIFEIIGWIATVLSVLMYIPQSLKVIKTRSVVGLSKSTFSFIFIGTITWVVYASLISLYQPLVTNLLILLLMLPIIWQLFKDKIYQVLILFALALASIILGIVFLIVNIATPTSVQFILLIIAALGITVSFTPQVVDLVKTKNTKSLSVPTISLLIAANIFWTMFWANQAASGSGYEMWLNAIATVAIIYAVGLQSTMLYVCLKYKQS